MLIPREFVNSKRIDKNIPEEVENLVRNPVFLPIKKYQIPAFILQIANLRTIFPRNLIKIANFASIIV